MFTAQRDLATAKQFREAVRMAAERHGRSCDDVKVLPGLCPVLGSDEADARRRLERMGELIHPDVGVFVLSDLLGVDLSSCPVDGPLPEDLPVPNGMVARSALIREEAREKGLTIRQLYQKLLTASGHFTAFGNAGQVADLMEEWLSSGAADGFNIMPNFAPSGIEEFVETVVPELRKRGIFKHDYEGRTLRENLRLAKPKSRFAAIHE